MMRIFIIIIFLTYSFISKASSEIVFLDVQFIIDNSKLGIFYKEKLSIVENNSKNKFIIEEKKIKNLEKEINSQKNILKKDEINKKVATLNNLLKNYRNKRKISNEEIINEKKKYAAKILNILNPLITNYVETNNIKIVLEKKNILVGEKTLDITDEILKILNNETIKKNLINEN